MYHRVTGLLRRMGVDRAVGFGVLTRAWGVIAGPITMFVIATGLTREQQGFYYTFGSLLAMQVFFELGLMLVIAQFASHEFAHLTWREAGRVAGDAASYQRFSELLGKSAKWFGAVSVLLVVALIPLGLWFLSRQEAVAADFAWRLPWILAVFCTAANLLAVPFLAVILGSGDVASVNQRELMGAIVGSCTSWIVISLHGGLYAAFAVNCGNALVSWGYLLKRKPELLRLAWRQVTGTLAAAGSGLGWWSEIWPMQWKIALSWVSGYFIFQLFTPVLFRYHGAAVAGQMGMTLSAGNALLAIGMTWINASGPEFGKLVSTGRWHDLDTLFFRVLSRSLGFVFLGAVTGGAVIWCLQSTSSLGQRFLPVSQACLLFATVCIQVAISSLAVYLRAHKKEPFLLLSLFGALLQGPATWFFGMRYSSLGIVGSYFVLSLCTGLPLAYLIWSRCRRVWHESSSSGRRLQKPGGSAGVSL